MSLAVLNEARETCPTDYAEMMKQAWGPVRVIIAAAARARRRVVKPLYDAMGTRIHLGASKDFDEVIRGGAGGGRPARRPRRAATSTEDDEPLRASHQRGIDLVGPGRRHAGHLGRRRRVLRPGRHARAQGARRPARLWDGCVLVAGTPGFYELKRTRTSGPVFD